MNIGVGIDGTLGLTWADEANAAREAAQLGYTSLWTPESNGLDAFQLCTTRWASTKEVTPLGLLTGIAVSPMTLRTPLAMAMSAGTASGITGGRFVLGIGTGSIPMLREANVTGGQQRDPVDLTREYVWSLKGLLAGQRVAYSVGAAPPRNFRLGLEPPPATPVYLGALGPRMLRLAGEVADGVALNWCTKEQIGWSRDRLLEGAKTAGRNQHEVKTVCYIRVSIDEDEDVARRSFVRALLGYAMRRPGVGPSDLKQGYSAHFIRMGFGDALAHIERLRDKGASIERLVDEFPADLAGKVGYFGRPEGAPVAIRSLADGLDTAIVRIVPARRGLEPLRKILEVCQPRSICDTGEQNVTIE
jgi:alkanesulfonate monooxygenase SsuD/methylene tetrahydromethanopterin reductase-like flavin-dependent oxidoreductase (luciferase family)